MKTKDYEKLTDKQEKIVHDLEDRLQQSLQKAIASLAIHSNKVLVQSESRNEFYIKDKKFQPKGPSKSCQEFITMLRPHIQAVKDAPFTSISGRIFSLLGKSVCTILIDFFAEIKLNKLGLLQLAVDVEEYNKFIDTFGEKAIKDDFKQFKALTKIYQVPQEGVQTYVQEETLLQGIEEDIINNYVQNRPVK